MATSLPSAPLLALWCSRPWAVQAPRRQEQGCGVTHASERRRSLWCARQELYSGAADCQIVVWAPERPPEPEAAPRAPAGPGAAAAIGPDRDEWSD
jgi:hypothetical protein